MHCPATSWQTATVLELLPPPNEELFRATSVFLKHEVSPFLGLSAFRLTSELWEVFPYKLEQSRIFNAFPLLTNVNCSSSGMAGFLTVPGKLETFISLLGSETAPIPQPFLPARDHGGWVGRQKYDLWGKNLCFSLNVFIALCLLEARLAGVEKRNTNIIVSKFFGGREFDQTCCK